jgi:hypothetical protein
VCNSAWLTYCNGACVNVATDPANCNTCGNACTAAGAICETGGAKNPTCVNVDWPRWTIPNSMAEVTNDGAPAASLESYTDNGDGTVTDKLTHLLWQQVPPTMGGTGTGYFVWADAKMYCQSLVLSGHHDWRLPSLIELQSIVDYGVTSRPTIDPKFTCSSDVFWSATPLAGQPTYAWYVTFSGGNSINDSLTNTHRVRCVR